MNNQFTPKIATHWTALQAATTYGLIKAQASEMDTEAVEAEVQRLMAASEESYKMVKCWDKRMQEGSDIIHHQTGDTYSEMAAILVMVTK